MRKLADQVYIAKGAKAPFEVLVFRPPMHYALDYAYKSKKEALKDAKRYRALDGGKYLIRSAQTPMVLRHLKKGWRPTPSRRRRRRKKR